MADVARRAGVSVATVSRALRHVEGVSAATRARVRQVAAELSYVVSPEASGLSRQYTGRVAVVVPRIDTWFYATMLAAIEDELRRADLDVLLYHIDGPAQRSQFLRDLPARRKVDAIVIVALPLPPDQAARLELMGVEVVVAGGRLRDYPCVHTDDYAIGTAAVGHLADLGHTRIAMIRTSDTDGTEWFSDIERVRGYRSVLAERGLSSRPDYLVSVPYSGAAGREGMLRLLGLHEPPTAVFAYSDEIGLGALSALRDQGIAVPGEMSLIGVDGHPMGALFGLDTVNQVVDDQGRQAGAMVLSLLGGRPREASEVVTPFDLCSAARRGRTGRASRASAPSTAQDAGHHDQSHQTGPRRREHTHPVGTQVATRIEEKGLGVLQLEASPPLDLADGPLLDPVGMHLVDQGLDRGDQPVPGGAQVGLNRRGAPSLRLVGHVHSLTDDAAPTGGRCHDDTSSDRTAFGQTAYCSATIRHARGATRVRTGSARCGPQV